jgi:uncharacterized protein YoxC
MMQAPEASKLQPSQDVLLIHRMYFAERDIARLRTHARDAEDAIDACEDELARLSVAVAANKEDINDTTEALNTLSQSVWEQMRALDEFNIHRRRHSNEAHEQTRRQVENLRQENAKLAANLQQALTNMATLSHEVKQLRDSQKEMAASREDLRIPNSPAWRESTEPHNNDYEATTAGDCTVTPTHQESQPPNLVDTTQRQPVRWTLAHIPYGKGPGDGNAISRSCSGKFPSAPVPLKT